MKAPETEAVPTTSKLVSGEESPIPSLLLSPSKKMVLEPTVRESLMVKPLAVPDPLTVKELVMTESGLETVLVVMPPLELDWENWRGGGI